MSAPITVGSNERGAIRVFAINRSPEDIAAALRTQPKPDLARQLLDSPHLNTASSEIFALSDLAGVGLSSYLTDGYAVEDKEISADRGKLDALEGFVLLVFSDSFEGTQTTLSPGDAVTLIGTYQEFTPPATGPALDTDSAKPYSGAPGMTPPTPARGRAGSVMVVVAVFVLSALGLWWMLT